MPRSRISITHMVIRGAGVSWNSFCQETFFESMMELCCGIFPRNYIIMRKIQFVFQSAHNFRCTYQRHSSIRTHTYTYIKSSLFDFCNGTEFCVLFSSVFTVHKKFSTLWMLHTISKTYTVRKSFLTFCFPCVRWAKGGTLYSHLPIEKSTSTCIPNTCVSNKKGKHAKKALWQQISTK